ncbi:hypothetical protein ACOME3_002281 [Neoechinorhynchus agilis]
MSCLSSLMMTVRSSAYQVTEGHIEQFWLTLSNAILISKEIKIFIGRTPLEKLLIISLIAVSTDFPSKKLWQRLSMHGGAHQASDSYSLLDTFNAGDPTKPFHVVTLELDSREVSVVRLDVSAGHGVGAFPYDPIGLSILSRGSPYANDLTIVPRQRWSDGAIVSTCNCSASPTFMGRFDLKRVDDGVRILYDQDSAFYFHALVELQLVRVEESFDSYRLPKVLELKEFYYPDCLAGF